MEPFRKSRVWHLAIVYAITWGVMLLQVIVLGALAALRVDSDSGRQPTEAEFQAAYLEVAQEGTFLAWWSIASGAILALLALAVALLSPVNAKSRLALTLPRPTRLLAWVSGILFVLSVAIFSDSAVLMIFGEQSEAIKALQRTTTNAEGSTAILLWFGIGFMAPFGEELVFRGLILTRLIERFGPVVGVSVSALAFALLHFDPQYILSVAPGGVALGFLAYRLKSTLPCIAAHVAVNLSYVATVRFFPAIDSGDASPLLFLASLFAAAATGLWFHKMTKFER